MPFIFRLSKIIHLRARKACKIFKECFISSRHPRRNMTVQPLSTEHFDVKCLNCQDHSVSVEESRSRSSWKRFDLFSNLRWGRWQAGAAVFSCELGCWVDTAAEAGELPGGGALFRCNIFGVALERRGLDLNGLSVLVNLSTGDLATCKLLVKHSCPQRIWNSSQRNYCRRLPWTSRLVDWLCNLCWSFVCQKQASSINANVKISALVLQVHKILSCWMRQSPSVHFCGASALF